MVMNTAYEETNTLEKKDTPMRAIDKYDVLIFDVGQTFMFNVDRFAADENFHATYRTLGGRTLDQETVQNTILDCLNYLMNRYESPDYYDRFPKLTEAMKTVAPGLDARERTILESSFARHECGHVPGEYAQCLKELSKTHRLGVISNIWAKKDFWLEEFRRKEIFDIFDVMVFSSDHSSIKPSPAIFERALEGLGTSRSKILFTGDSYRCDVCGAQNVGMTTALVLNDGPVPSRLDPQPDYLVTSMLELPLLD